MSEEKEIMEYPMHKHIDENGNVYWHSHAPGQHVDPDHEHYHVDELGNLFSHVHDHGEPVIYKGEQSHHHHPNDDPELQDASQEHSHVHPDGSVHTHVHEQNEEQEEGCTHSHDHAQTKAVINRLSRAIGHLESVKRMVENGRDCTEVLIQLAAVRSALSSTAKVILKDHLEHCISEVEPGNPDQFKALNDAIDRFM